MLGKRAIGAAPLAGSRRSVVATLGRMVATLTTAASFTGRRLPRAKIAATAQTTAPFKGRRITRRKIAATIQTTAPIKGRRITRRKIAPALTSTVRASWRILPGIRALAPALTTASIFLSRIPFLRRAMRIAVQLELLSSGALLWNKVEPEDDAWTPAALESETWTPVATEADEWNEVTEQADSWNTVHGSGGPWTKVDRNA